VIVREDCITVSYFLLATLVVQVEQLVRCVCVCVYACVHVCVYLCVLAVTFEFSDLWPRYLMMMMSGFVERVINSPQTRCRSAKQVGLQMWSQLQSSPWSYVGHVQRSTPYVRVHGHRMKMFLFGDGCTLWQEVVLFCRVLSTKAVHATSVALSSCKLHKHRHIFSFRSNTYRRLVL